MERELITIEGHEYVVAPNGAMFDDDGNVCGFLGSDIVGGENNLVDSYMSALEKEFAEEGAKGVGLAGARASGCLPLPILGAVVAVGSTIAVGMAVKEGVALLDAKAEQKQAEKQAEEMQRRLEEHRRRRR